MSETQQVIRFLGLKLHNVNMDQVHAYILETSRAGRKAAVLNLNVHCVCLALQNPWLADFINRAPLIFCDGDGVRWGLNVLGKPVPPKITYDRWIWQLSEFAAANGLSMYFVGGKPGIAQQAADRLKARYPSLKIAGTRDGYFDRQGEENRKVVDEISRTRPDILVVGFGMPIQEKWLMDNQEKLDARIFLTGGAVFDYAAGHFKRAPEWMIRAHLEWLFRALYDPKRLMKRYLMEIPYFFYRIFREKLAGT